MGENSHYIYVLKCSDGSFYTGYTTNLEKRVNTHNNGKGAKYTRGRLPVRLVYSKEFPTKSEALKAEYAFKQWSRNKKEQFLLKKEGEGFVAAKEL